MRVLNRLIAVGALSFALASCGEGNKEEAVVDADAPDVRQEVID